MNANYEQSLISVPKINPNLLISTNNTIDSKINKSQKSKILLKFIVLTKVYSILIYLNYKVTVKKMRKP